MKIENLVNMYFHKDVAKKYTIMTALVLNRILWSLTDHQNNSKDKKTREEFFIDGKWWMRNTYDALAAYFDGLISVRTIKECVTSLEKDGVLISSQRKAAFWKREKWYTVDEEKLARLFGLAVPEKEENPIITDGAKNVP